MPGNQCDQTHILYDDQYNQILISVQSFSRTQKFAASLKSINNGYTYGHDKKQQTGTLVVGFDSNKFIRYCDKASLDFESNCTDFNKIARELFQTSRVWHSSDLFCEAMEILSKYHGVLF